MSLLTNIIKSDSEYNHLLSAIEKEFNTPKTLPLLVTGLSDGAADSLFISIIKDTIQRKKPALIICFDERECSRLCDVLRVNSVKAAFYLPRDFTFYNISASHDYEHERIKVLYGVISQKLDVIITTPDSMLGYTISPNKLIEATIVLDNSVITDPIALSNKLICSGYRRVEQVDGYGQFAVRGGIIDIYPPYALYKGNEGQVVSEMYPLRIELFGDEIDRMGVFDPTTQRVTQNVISAEIPPAREVLVDDQMLDSIRKSILTLIKNTDNDQAKSELIAEERAVSEALINGAEVSFLDKYITKVYPERATLISYFDKKSLVLIKNTNEIYDRLKASKWHSDNLVKELCKSGTISPRFAEYCGEPAILESFFDESVTVHVDSIVRGLSGKRLGGLFSFKTRHTVSYAGNFKLLFDDLAPYKIGGWKIFIETENETSSINLCGLLNENGFSASVESKSEDFKLTDLPEGNITVCFGSAIRGYELIVPKIAILSILQDERTAGAAAARLRKKSANKKSSNNILSYSELSAGDYVVHEAYGIGQYEGIENLTVNGVSRDYINIKFAGSDRLYLPTEKINLLSKYIGARSDDGLVKLSKFGGAEWGNAKARAKAAVKEIAKDLIKLYAERQRCPGYAFPKNDDLQRDFEASFEYEETESQLIVADEIKDDMVKSTPMDRLLCGDVGFGKTEVALRAAYKAVLGGKQVAILVPTTLLALQHYQTTISRMRSFAVNVDMISRFRTSKQQTATIRAIKRGDIDIIVGTHRLLSKDIEFKNLGLLIVDEEQRFGVAQKEKIKQLAGNIDVLTLTATPIPRTLNMAMGGIRDISILDEAPEDRLPIQTYVLEEDDLIIFEAIRRELRRGGQVFYLHNIIETIDDVAVKLTEAFPEACITTAHGRMEKERLEDIWRSMLAGEIDILICTSIIETGVDVPNANTLIVDNAHQLGLSQLHQIRGRVGRSSRRAYAYFTFPKNRVLSEIAEKRLEAVREYSEFGSGFRIALRDLELRGAGNLLGAEQHGHLDAIGYELYIKLLHEAVLEEQGTPQKDKVDCTVNLDINAFVPEKYIKHQPQRISIYKRIARIETKDDRDDMYDELDDRFSTPPAEVCCLLDIALLRAKAVDCGFTKLTQQGTEIVIIPKEFKIDIWQELTNELKGKLRVILSNEPSVAYRIPSKQNPVNALAELLDKYIKILTK